MRLDKLDSQTLISIVRFSSFLCNHTAAMNSRLNVQRRSLFYELPYFGRNIILDHGQFNNCLFSHLPSKKYLESLCSIHDLDLFGGVGVYINDSLKYTVIEKTSEEAFQALWIEIQFSRKSNIICGMIYRQHNSPQRFLEYFDLTLEKLISSNKSVYIMGNFNINLLHVETYRYAYDFLLSLQSFSFIPTIDKPTRVCNNSATLIDNILTNKVDVKFTSGNIISDISDHYSQFCVFHTSLENSNSRGKRFRDFSGFSEETFNYELYYLLSNQINLSDSSDVDKAFSHFYDSLNVLVNKHAPLKMVSNRMRKQFSKPWITSGLKKSIKAKNFFLQSGNLVKYKFYRNRICTLTRLRKKNYFHAFFSDTLNNMKNTWNGINSLINNNRKKSKVVSLLKHLNDNSTTKDPLKISNLFNRYFTSVGHNLATQVPSSSHRFTEYLSSNNNYGSFFFDPVSPDDIEREILSIPKNKSYGSYSCPIRILSCAKHITFIWSSRRHI